MNPSRLIRWRGSPPRAVILLSLGLSLPALGVELSKQDLLGMVEAGVSQEAILALLAENCVSFEPEELADRIARDLLEAARPCESGAEPTSSGAQDSTVPLSTTQETSEAAPRDAAVPEDVASRPLPSPSRKTAAAERDGKPDEVVLEDLPPTPFDRMRPTGFGPFREVCYGLLKVDEKGIEFACYDHSRRGEEAVLKWAEVAATCLRSKRSKDVAIVRTRGGHERGYWFTTGGIRWDDPTAEQLRRREVQRFEALLQDLARRAPSFAVAQRCEELELGDAAAP